MKLTFTQLKPPGGSVQKNIFKYLLTLTLLMGLAVPKFALAQTAPCNVTTLNITSSASGGNSNKGLAGNFGTPTTPPPTLGTYTITLYRIDEFGNYTDPFSRPNNVTLNIVGNNWEVYANGAQNIPGGSYVAVYQANLDQNCSSVQSVTSATYCHVTSQIKTLAATPVLTTSSLFTTSTTVSGTSTDGAGTVSLFVNGNLALKPGELTGYKTTISNNAWTIDITGILLKADDIITVRAITNTSCLSGFSNSVRVFDNSTEKTAIPTIAGTYCAPFSPQTTSLTLTGMGVPGSTISLYNDGTANTTAPSGAPALVTTPANIIVASNGIWSATVSGIDAGFNIKAIAKSSTQTQSDYSTKAAINGQPTPKTVNFSSNLVCSGGTVNATIISSEANVTYQLMNNGVPSGNPVVGNGGDINLISGTLTADASFKVRASYGTATCDINMPETAYAVTVVSPQTKTINYSSKVVCSGGTVTAIIVSSEIGVTYQLMNYGKETGTPLVGNGGDITLVSDPLTADASLNVEATKTDIITCDTYLSLTWFAVTVNPIQSTEGLTFNFPVLSRDRKVSGTFPIDGAKVNVYIDNTFLGTATVTAGVWSLTGLKQTDLYDGGIIYASVSQTNTCESKRIQGPTVGNTILPVELLFFTAKSDNGKVNLVWSTAMERNNDYFEIQKSANGIQFNSIGKVAGAGNSLSIKDYSFTDKEQVNGTAYYRLKQVDLDNGFEYSKVVALNSMVKSEAQQILAYPNPTTSQITIIIKPGVSENYALEIRDLVGKVVLTKEVVFNDQNSETTLDIQHLPAGTYLITARSKKEQVVTRIVKN